MTINIFVLKGELNGKNRSGAFLFLSDIFYTSKWLNIPYEYFFLHRNSFRKAEAEKFHVQIMRFMCCLNMAFNLTKPIWAHIYLQDTQEMVAALTDHFASAFVCENVVGML